MPYLGLDFVNAFQIKVTAFGNGPRGILRDNACIGQRKAGGSFNLKPAAKFIFITPDSAHLWAGITWNQRFALKNAGT
jgi:hypothetical protein